MAAVAEHAEQLTEGMDIDEPEPLSRSPSPAAPTKVVQYVEGRNSYTEEDRSFFAAYVQHVFKYEPKTTLPQLAEKLHKKVRVYSTSNAILVCLLSVQVPHHSVASWQSYAGRTEPKQVLTDAKNSGHIRARKQERQQVDRSARVSPKKRASQMSDVVAEDAMIMAEFLKNGVPEGVSDEDAYAELAWMVGSPCHSQRELSLTFKIEPLQICPELARILEQAQCYSLTIHECGSLNPSSSSYLFMKYAPERHFFGCQDSRPRLVFI